MHVYLHIYMKICIHFDARGSSCDISTYIYRRYVYVYLHMYMKICFHSNPTRELVCVSLAVSFVEEPLKQSPPSSRLWKQTQTQHSAIMCQRRQA